MKQKVLVDQVQHVGLNAQRDTGRCFRMPAQIDFPRSLVHLLALDCAAFHSHGADHGA